MIRWLGHSAFEITTSNDKSIFIDPWIDNPSSPIHLDNISKSDLILVTHDHFDHVGNTVDIYKKTDAVVVTNPETANKLSKSGVENVVGMNIGGSVEPIAGVKVTMVQAFHSSESGCPAGFLLHMDGKIIYHAGDTGIFSSMELLGDLYDINVAMIPIGSVFTMDPYQAAKSLRLLKPDVVIPMHYGTFPALVKDANEFLDLAKKEYPEAKVVILKPGEELRL